jgi:dTDP-4-amino-4,6-dideoxygalactose transaminase
MKHIQLLNLSRQYLSLKPAIDSAISRVLSRGDFILGEDVWKFEKEFSKFTGSRNTIGVSNGTDAILLALQALDITKGDEIIVQANTFIATLLPILSLGAKPILVDVDEDTGQINPEEVKKAITHNTKAIIVVHLYGHPAPISKIQLATRDALRVTHHEGQILILEDCAQAHGTMIQDKHVGSFGAASTFSFYPGKNLGAAGDAGAIVTDNNKIAKTLTILRNIGQDRKYHHLLRGGNYRLDTVQAAILLAKLKHLKQWNSQRNTIAKRYIKEFSTIKQLSLPSFPDTGNYAVWHQFIVRTQKRDALAMYLEKHGIATGIHYPIPLHLQPALKNLGYKKGDFPSSENRAKTMLSLPIDPELTEIELKHIIQTIKKFFS